MPPPNRDPRSPAADAVRSGVRAVGSMGEALRQTVGIGGRYRDDERRRAPGAAALIDEIAGMLADFLDQAGDVAQDVARGIDERTLEDPSAPARREVEMTARAGESGLGKFTIWNRGDVKLTDVGFNPTALLGPDRYVIPAKAITFDPSPIALIAPRQGEPVTIQVDVPPDAVPGTYHGLVRAWHGDASVLLHLVVERTGFAQAVMMQPDEATSA